MGRGRSNSSRGGSSALAGGGGKSSNANANIAQKAAEEAKRKAEIERNMKNFTSLDVGTSLGKKVYSASWYDSEGKYHSLSKYLRTADLIADAKAQGATADQIKKMKDDAKKAKAARFIKR